MGIPELSWDSGLDLKIDQDHSYDLLHSDHCVDDHCVKDPDLLHSHLDHLWNDLDL